MSYNCISRILTGCLLIQQQAQFGFIPGKLSIHLILGNKQKRKTTKNQLNHSVRGAMKKTVILSRITGFIMVLFVISCNSTQPTLPSSIQQAEPATTKAINPTVTPQILSETSPEAAQTELPVIPPQIEVSRDIPYTSQLELDVYQPSGTGPWPVVVALHGGGQSKELFNLFSKRIAQLGAVVFTPTWRSSEPQGDPLTKEIITAGIQDAACALRFARQWAKDYGGDPSRLVIVGYSGGGTAAAVVALAGADAVPVLPRASRIVTV